VSDCVSDYVRVLCAGGVSGRDKHAENDHGD